MPRPNYRIPNRGSVRRYHGPRRCDLGPLAKAASVCVSAVRGFEIGECRPVAAKLGKSKRALEAASVEFVPVNVGERIMRLAKREQDTMIEPTGCHIWSDADQVLRGWGGVFEVLESYQNEDHFRRSLMRCRDCGHLYFYEFAEWKDLQDGDDPTYRCWVPVATLAHIESLKTMSQAEIKGVRPLLVRDYPKGRPPMAAWLRAI